MDAATEDPQMLLVLLFGPPLAAIFTVRRQNLAGMAVVRPFGIWGGVAFALTGVFLIGVLFGGDYAVSFLFMGTAAFGGAMSCWFTAAFVWFREQRKSAVRGEGRRSWPHRGEGDV